jgi:arylsulfatase A-like enzyme
VRRAIVVTVDGLRRDMISSEATPNLNNFERQAERLANYRTVFPSCTRVVSASMATGCFPARHGLQGNSVALLEDGRLVSRDAGYPDFLQHKRRLTGCSLAVPTLAQRVKDHGGAIIFSNVSPGAAYAHDPDGYGYVYHRAGSFGPGRRPLPEGQCLDVTLDVAGDRRMTERFASEILYQTRPAVAVLWLSEPDHMQHELALGSPEHRSVLSHADAHVGLVIEAVERLRASGDDVLLFVGSDHGHQTVEGVVDVDAELVAGGVKAGQASDDVLAVSNGTAVLIYVRPDHASKVPKIRAFLAGCEWAGQVFGPDELGIVGQAAEACLAFAISMRANQESNMFGVPGLSLAAKPAAGKPDRLGCGQHRGLGEFEQSPFMLISGLGFDANTIRREPACVVDIAPTILQHLGLSWSGLDGRPLQAQNNC